MKRFSAVVYLLGVLIALQGAAVVLAKGPQGVANGLHNMSSSALSNYKSDEPEICVFCHTPHGGSTTGPLWNKPDLAGPYTHYTTDNTTNPELIDTNRPISDQSLLCMSCHDGTASVNTVINLPNTRNGLPIQNEMNGGPSMPMVVGFGAFNPVLDIDLTNDHPISFSYDGIYQDYLDAGLLNKLSPVATAQAAGVRFFGATNYVECSTCHDPHVDYSVATEYTPFLITPNDGSNLCLACHIK